MSTGLTMTLALLALAAALIARAERVGATELALIAAVGAVAAAGRVLFAAVPGVQPVTVICLVAGATLGLRAGLLVGPVAALISNAFLGHGPWTPAQMALWAGVGALGALLGVRADRARVLAAAGFAAGLAFSWAMNAWFLATFGPELSAEAFLAATARSLPFDLAHALGNVAIALAVGPALARLLRRYSRRTGGRVTAEDQADVASGPVSTRARIRF